jgi:hypothetical protein
MKKIILFLLLLFSYSVNAQIIPSFQGVYDKKLGVSDAWDTSNSGDLTFDGNTVTHTGFSGVCGGGNYGWMSAYGTEEISSGTKTWKIKVGNFVDSNCNVFDLVIGIVNLKNKGDNYYWVAQSGVQAYCYNAQSGVKHKMTGTSWSSTSSYGASYGTDDVIKVSLNMSNGELRYYKNDVDQGVAFTVNTSLSYYLGVGLQGAEIVIIQ